MSLERSNSSSNSSSNGLPIGESTPVEKNSLKRLKQTLITKLGLSSNSTSGTPSAKRSQNNKLNLSKLDPQIYLDTQSNGFASRVVKYHEASEAKNREITNRSYRRPGDFPIVNLDKSEINLNKKLANEPKISKINISSPVNLISASNSSARSAIFRTGKNYGDNYPTDKIGPIEGRKPIKPIKPTISPDEPIVLANNEYENTPTRSSLEALKEISRKRIHCDEIDGDTNKKQRADNTQNECDQNSLQASISSKRPRDRTSPSYSSSTIEVQKKRYKNNDILSSLSSSISFNNANAQSTSKQQTVHEKNDKDVQESDISGDFVINKRQPDSSRVGTSNSDLPLHRPSEQIKPVTKSMSDGYVPNQPTSKAPKITLFNKDYSNVKSSSNNKELAEDDDENSISFVKPKTKTTSIFRNRDKESKLAMMLSFLRGDEPRDEVDCVKSDSSDINKSGQVEKPEETVSSTSNPANLSTITSVTFSTATTTSLLNVPSTIIAAAPVAKPSTTEPSNVPTIEPKEVPQTVKESAESAKSSESVTPLITVSAISSPPSIPLPTATTSQSATSDSSAASKTPSSRSVTFNFSSATTSSIPSMPTSTSASVPRLGGFAFSGTPSSTSSVTLQETKPVIQESATKPGDTQPATKATAPPSFSFGLSKPASSTALPTFTPPTFGSNSLINAQMSTAQTSASNVPQTTTSAPVTFNFGSPATKASALQTSTPLISFGTPSTNNAPSTTTNSTTFGQSPVFSFGATAKSTSPSTVLAPNTTVTSAPAASPFVFGSNAPSVASPFGMNTTPVSVTTAASIGSTSNLAAPTFSFGGAGNAEKPGSGGFQFGKTNTTTHSSTLASPNLKNAAPALPFGTSNATNPNPNPLAPPSSAFTFGANKPTEQKQSIFGTPTTTQSPPSFGAFSTPAFGQSNTAPTFGSVGANIATTTTTTNAINLFGSTQSPPAFGVSNVSSTQPKVENAFGMPSAQNSNASVFGGQNQANAFSKPTSPPAYGSSNNNVFGNVSNTSNQPTFGASNNLFATPTTTSNPIQSSSNAFGSTAASPFAFGQTTPATPATTASTGLFGNTNTNTNTNSIAPFVFGQGNAAQSSGMFDTKPVQNATTNSALSAPATFGSPSQAFDFSAKPVFGSQSESKPPAFSFNAQSNTTANVTTFGSAPTAPQFGSTNGMGSGSFPFSANNNPADAPKPFNFGGPATAPAATAQAPFSFSPATPNTFQFGGTPQMQQPAAANIFSIGPSSSTTKTGRPMRTATRRMK